MQHQHLKIKIQKLLKQKKTKKKRLKKYNQKKRNQKKKVKHKLREIKKAIKSEEGDKIEEKVEEKEK